MIMQSIANLTDRDLLAGAKRVVLQECGSTATLVAHLVEIEKRKLYFEEGCSSLFKYCTEVLHLSEHAAYNRIEAARVAVRCPAVLEWLERGDVHVTAVKHLASLLTPENHETLLAAAKHKSRREIDELVARLSPRPDAPDLVRAVGRAKPSAPTTATVTAGSKLDSPLIPPAASEPAGSGAMNSTEPAAEETKPATEAPPFTLGAPPARPAAATVVPLAPQRYKIQFTADAVTHDKLRRAQELLRHKVPNGDLAQVFGRALDLLVRDLERSKLGATDRPRSDAATVERTSGNARGGKAPRYIPAAVRRAVWARDQGRCSFVSPSGVRCTERGRLEFDHLWPHGDGGPATVNNVRVLCQGHNLHMARQFFGVWQSDDVPRPADSASSDDSFRNESCAATSSVERSDRGNRDDGVVAA